MVCEWCVSVCGEGVWGGCVSVGRVCEWCVSVWGGCVGRVCGEGV